MRASLKTALLAAGALALASCASANMNANGGQQSANQDAGRSANERHNDPPQFRRPLPQSGLWGGPGIGYGSMY